MNHMLTGIDIQDHKIVSANTKETDSGIPGCLRLSRMAAPEFSGSPQVDRRNGFGRDLSFHLEGGYAYAVMRSMKDN